MPENWTWQRRKKRRKEKGIKDQKTILFSQKDLARGPMEIRHVIQRCFHAKKDKKSVLEVVKKTRLGEKSDGIRVVSEKNVPILLYGKQSGFFRAYFSFGVLI